MALVSPSKHPEYFEYFLNHKPGVPLDFTSYHFYAVPTADQSLETQQHTFFAQAGGFLNTVRYVESMRKRLSPETKTTINEVGAISADDTLQEQPGHVTQPIPNAYWNLTCAMSAYLFGEMTKMGIDVWRRISTGRVSDTISQRSMVDWNTGKPNARLWALKLLRENFGPGDKLVEMEKMDEAVSRHVYSLAVIKPDGKRRFLLVNKRDRPFDFRRSVRDRSSLV